MAGFENALVLALIPVAAAALYYVFVYDYNGAQTERRRYAMFAARLVVVTLLLVAVAQPFIIDTEVEEGDERVQMLVDESDSMEVFDDVTQELASGIEDEGIDVDVTPIASGDSSPLGDAVVRNVERNGSVLLVSDGQTTTGRSLSGAAETARGLGAQVNAVNLTATETERYVEVIGSSKASEGVEETYTVRVGGVNIDGEANQVDVEIDGETVESETVEGEGSFEFEHTFDSTGDHRITATVDGTGDGVFERNEEFYKTVRVVERPDVLYVGSADYPLAEFLDGIYDLDRSNEIPSSLSPDDYYAVVLQNMHADEMGDVGALQDFVIEGGGLVVAGGPNAYEGGGYDASPVGSMVPVRSGEDIDDITDIMLVLDVSANTGVVFGDVDEIMDMAEEGGLDISREEAEAIAERTRATGDLTLHVRGTALDVVDQLGDQNRVGLIAAVGSADTLVSPAELSTNRGEITNTIERITSPGGADVRVNMVDGIQQAAEDLGGRGHIIVISDGLIYGGEERDANLDPEVADVARQVNARGMEVHTVTVGGHSDNFVNDIQVMQDLAETGGGQSMVLEETEKLGLMFGDDDVEVDGEGLIIMDSNHFITQGVETTTDLPAANEVTVKPTGRHLASTGDGDTALAAGRYGLGRVVSYTAHAGDGILGGLLQEPDSALVSRGVNWAVGDPERLATDLYDISDTRVGEPTEVSYRGDSAPSVDGIDFRQAGTDEYVGSVTPDERGFENVEDAVFAVNYPAEYAGFGTSPELETAVRQTGGGVYEPTQTAAIAEDVRSHVTEPRDTRRGLEWLALVAALLIYLVEVCARRLEDVYGYSIGNIMRSWS